MTQKSFLIHVVEDNEYYNKLLVHTLSLNPDYEIRSFYTAKDFLNALHEQPNVVTLDYRLPDQSGKEVLEKIKKSYPDIEVIMISDQEDIEVAVELLKAGAYDYIVKSEDLRGRLLNIINHVRSNSSLKDKVSRLQKEVERKYDFKESIIGNSPAIHKIFELIEKSLLANVTVSISGETGTGKELVAKAIHYNSNRKKKNFVAVNLAATPSDLVESELFGHEKGAFTGAMTRRKGKFEEAHEGHHLSG